MYTGDTLHSLSHLVRQLHNYVRDRDSGIHVQCGPHFSDPSLEPNHKAEAPRKRRRIVGPRSISVVPVRPYRNNRPGRRTAHFLFLSFLSRPRSLPICPFTLHSR